MLAKMGPFFSGNVCPWLAEFGHADLMGKELTLPTRYLTGRFTTHRSKNPSRRLPPLL